MPHNLPENNIFFDGALRVPMDGVVDAERMRAAAGRAAALLRALGNEDRLLLLCRLSQGECTVGELEADLGIRQPTLSQQLAVLRGLSLVATRRAGRHVHYVVNDPKALVLLETLYSLYCATPEEEDA